MDRKRLFALLLAVLLCASLALPALASEEDFVIEDGALQEYRGPGGQVVIPDGVLWISNGVFAWRDDVTAVVFPEGLVSIGECAFYHCAALGEVSLPKSVAYIGSSAFYGCTGLERVSSDGDGAANLCHIYEDAFAGCTALDQVSFPDATIIDANAFQGTPWQARQDHRSSLTREIVRLLVCVALVAAAAGLIVAVNRRSKK